MLMIHKVGVELLVAGGLGRIFRMGKESITGHELWEFVAEESGGLKEQSE